MLASPAQLWVVTRLVRAGAGMLSGVDVLAEIAANVWKIRVEVGAVVEEGDELMILESMKMEIPVEAQTAGTVSELRVAEKDQVQEGDVLAVIDP